MTKTLLLVAGPVVGLAILVSAAAATAGEANAGCRPGLEGRPGGCVDPVGDATGARKPDIVRVTESCSGVISFRIIFAKGSRLAHSPAFTDTVSVTLLAKGQSTRWYRLTLTARDLTHEVLRRLPSGKPVTLALPINGLGLGNAVSLAADLDQIGNPSIVRYRAEAARVFLDGAIASSDVVPNKGAMVWYER
jgi:hypothetical protein